MDAYRTELENPKDTCIMYPKSFVNFLFKHTAELTEYNPAIFDNKEFIAPDTLGKVITSTSYSYINTCYLCEGANYILGWKAGITFPVCYECWKDIFFIVPNKIFYSIASLASLHKCLIENPNVNFIDLLGVEQLKIINK